MKKLLHVFIACLALVACGDGRDPGFVCMANCDHGCADGISGDSCRADKQRQQDDMDKQQQQQEQQKDDNYAY